MTALHKCAHALCTCQIPQEQSFCSDHCATQAAKRESDTCDCGHDDCAESVANQPDHDSTH